MKTRMEEILFSYNQHNLHKKAFVSENISDLFKQLEEESKNELGLITGDVNNIKQEAFIQLQRIENNAVSVIPKIATASNADQVQTSILSQLENIGNQVTTGLQSLTNAITQTLTSVTNEIKQVTDQVQTLVTTASQLETEIVNGVKQLKTQIVNGVKQFQMKKSASSAASSVVAPSQTNPLVTAADINAAETEIFNYIKKLKEDLTNNINKFKSSLASDTTITVAKEVVEDSAILIKDEIPSSDDEDLRSVLKEVRRVATGVKVA